MIPVRYALARCERRSSASTLGSAIAPIAPIPSIAGVGSKTSRSIGAPAVGTGGTGSLVSRIVVRDAVHTVNRPTAATTADTFSTPMPLPATSVRTAPAPVSVDVVVSALWVIGPTAVTRYETTEASNTSAHPSARWAAPNVPGGVNRPATNAKGMADADSTVADGASSKCRATTAAAARKASAAIPPNSAVVLPIPPRRVRLSDAAAPSAAINVATYPAYRAASGDHVANTESLSRATASTTSSNNTGDSPVSTDCSISRSPSRTPDSDNVRFGTSGSCPTSASVQRCWRSGGCVEGSTSGSSGSCWAGMRAVIWVTSSPISTATGTAAGSPTSSWVLPPRTDTRTRAGSIGVVRPARRSPAVPLPAGLPPTILDVSTDVMFVRSPRGWELT